MREVRSAIEFVAGHNRDGVGGGPGEGMVGGEGRGGRRRPIMLLLSMEMGTT